MAKLKKTLISVGIMLTVLMTITATMVSAESRIHEYDDKDPNKGLISTMTVRGKYSALTAFPTSCILTSIDEIHKGSVKYASCSTFKYNEKAQKTNQKYVKYETVKSGNVTTSTATTYKTNANPNGKNLTIADNSIVKTEFYGEIHSTCEQSSAIIERIWITRFRQGYDKTGRVEGNES